MSRAIWKGAISFGLVYVPVELYPATRAAHTGFNLLDRRTLDPVGYRQINKRTGKEMPRDDIVRGYEYEKDKYVVLSDDEIAAASPEATQTVDILAFVEAPQVSFLYLDTPYWLAPAGRGDKPYALLRDALAASGKLGIANVVMHSRQHLAALVPAGEVLVLYTLRWSDEVRSQGEIGALPHTAKASGVSARELEMARRLIDEMSAPWRPEDYHDTFHDEIMQLVERKIRAGKAHEIEAVGTAAPARRSADVVDLSELLKRSLGRRPGSGGRVERGGGNGGNGGNGGQVRDARAAKADSKRSRRAA